MKIGEDKIVPNVKGRTSPVDILHPIDCTGELLEGEKIIFVQGRLAPILPDASSIIKCCNPDLHSLGVLAVF